MTRYMERRQSYDARQWDGDPGITDWLGPAAFDPDMGGPFTYDENNDALYQFETFLIPHGSWIVDRGGWWDILPDQAFATKYEEFTAADEQQRPAQEPATGDQAPGDDDTPPAEPAADAPAADEPGDTAPGQ